MNVVGLIKTNVSPHADTRATRAWNRDLSFHAAFIRCTSLSTSQKPALCRVPTYSEPGLPRPTIAMGGTTHATRRMGTKTEKGAFSPRILRMSQSRLRFLQRIPPQFPPIPRHPLPQRLPLRPLQQLYHLHFPRKQRVLGSVHRDR